MLDKLIAFVREQPRGVQVFAAIVGIALASAFAYLTWIEPKLSRGTVEVPTAQHWQAQMAFTHIGEVPAARTVLRDSAAGTDVVEHYASDDAALFVRTAPGVPSVKLWALHPAKAAALVDEADAILRLPDLPDGSSVFVTEPAYAGEPPRCLEPHPGSPVASWTEDAGNGWTRYWLRWADYCEGYLLCNAATGCGAAINWTRCTH